MVVQIKREQEPFASPPRIVSMYGYSNVQSSINLGWSINCSFSVKED